MTIPEVSPATLQEAMDRFDRQLRNTPNWTDWQQDETHKYAIQQGDRLYPVKQIVSLATGIPVSAFHGGDQANGYVGARGFTVVALPRKGSNHPLSMDRAQKVALKPDLSWWQDSKCMFVGDVKYKRINVPGIRHPNLYQLLAYTIAAELLGGLLIYAAGEGEPAVHEVVNVGKQLEVISMDLSGTPSEILDEVSNIARTIRRKTEQPSATMTYHS